MKKSIIIFIGSFFFWAATSGLVIRTNRLWLGPVTLRWPTLAKPNATFRWSTAPAGSLVIVSANSRRSFKVTVPRRFGSGELSISTSPGQGNLTAHIDTPFGKPSLTGSTPAGGKIGLGFDWDTIAVQTRTFNVDLTTDAGPIQILAIAITLQ